MTTASSGVVLRELTESDTEALASFSCRNFRQPWTDLIEEMVREKLADAIGLGEVRGVGLWRGDELLGVAAWNIDVGPPRLCRSVLVAVQTGHRMRGHAWRLKQAVLDHARIAGASAVVSHVHWDNEAMIELNVELGANVEAIPGDFEYCRCIIAL